MYHVQVITDIYNFRNIIYRCLYLTEPFSNTRLTSLYILQYRIQNNTKQKACSSPVLRKIRLGEEKLFVSRRMPEVTEDNASSLSDIQYLRVVGRIILKLIL